MLGRVIVSCIMPWRSSFRCHRMCCGPDTLLWFALVVFRVADMIGIVEHVSFLHPEKKGVKRRDWVAVVRQHLDSHQPAGAAITPCGPPPRRRKAEPVAACTTAGQPLAAPQAVGHHTAVDSILHCSVAAGSPGDPRAHRSQGAGSSQGPDVPRLAPGGIRYQAASRST